MKQKVYVEASALVAPHLSGVGHTLLYILRQWQADRTLRGRFEIILLVPFDKQKALAAHGLGFAVRRLPLPEKLLRALRRFNLVPPLDLVLGKAVYLFPNYWNWPLARSRSVTYVYDVSFLIYPEFTEPKNRQFLSAHLPIWLKRTDRVIAISDTAKQEIIKACKVEPDKVEVVYNGVNTADFNDPGTAAVKAAKKKYSIEGSYILFVGNLEPRKNLSRLIAAYRLLPKDMQQTYSLVLVGGDGWNNRQIMADITQAQADGLAVRRIAQFVPDADMPALYAGAAVLAHPALHEGFGMTPLEAMACGTPVVVSDIPVLREVLDGAAVFADPLAPPSIAAGLRQLLGDNALRSSLAKKAAVRVREFGWDRTVQRLAQVLAGQTGYKG